MPSGPLLPSTTELREISEAARVAAIQASDRVSRRKFTYAMTSLIGGIVCFLSMIGGFLFLVVHGFTAAAGWLLGTALFAIAGRLIGARLSME